jgi:uncharacterized protein YgiB involved in biofilm formation
MPLMAGYMMGRLMGGGMALSSRCLARKPGQPGLRQYTDASGKTTAQQRRVAP